ncbi:hypothetical protein FK531_20290 [Rhodococcus spelaei]|uniref:Uncharacterized protein n=1 Tax=Rhodococcus spelaei TaxID=2546320 RepID=A0A541B0C7_9NOCA|nr:hypothetical protein [Rhodococcus spelaei]TQF65771.1 hypothetical protein FK531_20290 [Rhodococcus spelaei]
MTDNAPSQWNSLAASAASGQLHLNRGVARQCAQRCSAFLIELVEIKRNAMGLASIDGFGTQLKSGVALAAKFEKKAANGDYSLDQAIADHIKVVEQMQHVFEEIEARYAASDAAAARGIDSAGATMRGN